MSTWALENYSEEKGLAFGHDPEGFLKGRKACTFSKDLRALLPWVWGRASHYNYLLWTSYLPKEFLAIEILYNR